MEQKALLRAIRKAPADLTLRLVYADWLDEHDDPLAAYVRAECDLLAAEPGGPEWRAAIDRLIAVTRKAKTNLGGWEYADDIARLRARSGRRGSSCNLLRAPPDELAVLRFEQRHRITLPGEYRAFLLRLGNGWAEPNRNGICRFDPAGNIPTLTKPFPHSAADAARFLAEFKASLSPDGYDPPEGAEDREYTDKGCKCIAEFGCGNGALLVVRGELRGQVWSVGDSYVPWADDTFTRPLGFFEWFEAIDEGPTW
ncbi:MAG TPA: TIGR02996 domain-containing protein [Gemmataceae bacterium]|nr:TIGR02996 domain-containing protein [Gemmataceae bacterium]